MQGSAGVAPARLLQKLKAHLPHALPLLGRLRFASSMGGTSESAHVLEATAASSGSSDGTGGAFAAAYVDLCNSHEANMWVYCSAEREAGLAHPRDAKKKEDAVANGAAVAEAPSVDAAASCLSALMAKVGEISESSSPPRGTSPSSPPAVVVAALSTTTRHLLLREAAVDLVCQGVWDRWDLPVEAMPQKKNDSADGGELTLPRGYVWADVTPADAAVAIGYSGFGRTV